MNIQLNSVTSYIGLALLAFGGFMILAGLDIISIQQVTVKKGHRTWMMGAIFAVVGFVMLFPEFTSSSKVPSPEVVTENLPNTATTPTNMSTDTLKEWAPIDIVIANSNLWRETAEGTYTANGSKDAFAWSKEQYAGNLMVSFDIESSASQASGCAVVYGNGQGLSYGNLIFCVDWDGYGLEKHTIYHEGENYLTFVPSDVDLQNNVYSVTIDIIDDTANMYVNGDKVFSSFFNTQEIDRSGRIGLLKKWFDPEVTFSNIRIRTPEK
jgi:hypothetical protein